ncbi:hypothetical protein Bca4012_010520 [Brassica carinata]
MLEMLFTDVWTNDSIVSLTLATLRTPSASREVSAAEERGTPSNDNDNNLALVPSDRDPEVEASDHEQRVADTGVSIIPADGQPVVLLSSDTSGDGQEEDRGTEVNEDGEQEGVTGDDRIERVDDQVDNDRVGDEAHQTKSREDADLSQEQTEHSGESLGNTGAARVD